MQEKQQKSAGSGLALSGLNCYAELLRHVNYNMQEACKRGVKCGIILAMITMILTKPKHQNSGREKL